MGELSAEVQYLIGKSIRRGTTSWGVITQVSEEYGDLAADALTETLHEAGVRFIEEQDASITPRTNVLMNDLTLVELVSLCLQLPVVPKTPRRLHQHVLKQRSYELDLSRLDYLDSDYEWYYLAPAFNSLQRSIRRLFDAGEIPFAQGWQKGDRKTNPDYLKGLMAHPAFAERILPKVRAHYLGLREVRLLVDWIKATGELQPTMVDIIRAGLERAGAEAVRSLLLSDQPSTAGSALEGRRDVCFSCPPHQRCQPLQGVADPYEVLMEYRSATLETLVESRYPNLPMGDCLLKDGLLAKFFVPYSLVVTSKKFMIDVYLLDTSSIVLRKNTGKYCPVEDRWFLADSGGSSECQR